MFSSKFWKILFFAAVAVCSSCKFWDSSSNSNTAKNKTDVAEIKSDIPFSTIEPAIFQAEITIKTDGNEENFVFARGNSGSFIKTGDIATLENAGKTFLIDFGKKTYVENPINAKQNNSEPGETLRDILTVQWLNQKADVGFEDLGKEGGLTKYRVGFDSSESIIFVDESLNMPVRQEFYSIEGEKRDLVYSFEMKNIKTTPDQKLFEVPKDFRKVSREEFDQNTNKK